MAKDKRRYLTIHKELRHMSQNQGGPTCTIRIATVKRGPRSTMEINRHGLHYGPTKIRRVWHHTGSDRSADQNEPFHSMLKRPGRTAVRQSLHEGDSHATRTTTWYHHRQGDAIYLWPMERNHGKIRNRAKTGHSFPSTNRRTNQTNQCHIGTIPTSIHQLSARRLVWLLTSRRIRVQQRISGDHQEHPFLCKLRN